MSECIANVAHPSPCEQELYSPISGDFGRLLPLSQGLFALISSEDFERASAFRWSAVRTSTKRLNFYVQRSTKAGGSQSLHRFLLSPPDWLVVDHIDGDGLNNLRSNLRCVTRAENNRNRTYRASALAMGRLPPMIFPFDGVAL